MSNRPSRTLTSRIQQVATASPGGPLSEGAVQTNGTGIDQYTETAPGPCQSSRQICRRSHVSGLRIVQLPCVVVCSTNIPNSKLFANRDRNQTGVQTSY